MFLDVCFAAPAASREPFFDASLKSARKLLQSSLSQNVVCLLFPY